MNDFFLEALDLLKPRALILKLPFRLITNRAPREPLADRTGTLAASTGTKNMSPLLLRILLLGFTNLAQEILSRLGFRAEVRIGTRGNQDTFGWLTLGDGSDFWGHERRNPCPPMTPGLVDNTYRAIVVLE